MTRIKIPPLSVIEAILLCAVALVPASAGAQTTEKKGTTPYVTHFIFRPIMSIDIPGLGTATSLEAVGTRPRPLLLDFLQSTYEAAVGDLPGRG